jgi:NAD(P)-dependent dehydrogenase (short-subunit alcohol dehydrogenase family)
VNGNVVIITGASSGLGVQLARALLRDGAVPVLAARRAERLAQLRDELPGADTVVCDVTDAADRERLVERHGRIDGLVNNAGAGAHGPALTTPVERFAQVVDLNLTAPFALSCLVAPHLRNGGGKSIVNIASVMGLRSIGEIPDGASWPRSGAATASASTPSRPGSSRRR